MCSTADTDAVVVAPLTHFVVMGTALATFGKRTTNDIRTSIATEDKRIPLFKLYGLESISKSQNKLDSLFG